MRVVAFCVVALTACAGERIDANAPLLDTRAPAEPGRTVIDAGWEIVVRSDGVQAIRLDDRFLHRVELLRQPDGGVRSECGGSAQPAGAEAQAR